MTSHIRSIAVLLMVGAALGTTPVLAADAVAGSRIAFDNVNRGAPVSLPETTPQPTPRVDAASLSRGLFGLDAETALDSLGTLSVDAEGNVVETPASGELRDIFALEVEGRR